MSPRADHKNDSWATLSIRMLAPAELRKSSSADRVGLQGRPRLTGRELVVPSDLSSAAFFLVAALLVSGADIYIRGVGLNVS